MFTRRTLGQIKALEAIILLVLGWGLNKVLSPLFDEYLRNKEVYQRKAMQYDSLALSTWKNLSGNLHKRINADSEVIGAINSGRPDSAINELYLIHRKIREQESPTYATDVAILEHLYNQELSKRIEFNHATVRQAGKMLDNLYENRSSYSIDKIKSECSLIMSELNNSGVKLRQIDSEMASKVKRI